MYRNYKFLVLLCIVMGLATAVAFSRVKETPVPYLPDSPRFLYDKHMLACPECSRPLMDEDGNEHGLCEVGYELLVEALKAERKLK